MTEACEAAGWLRILDQAVDDPVECDAGSQYGLVDQRVLLGRYVAVFALVNRLCEPDPAGMEMDHPVGRSAGDDPVIIGWKALRFLQCLLASAGASVPIRVFRRFSIECLDDRFGFDGHFVFRAVGVIDQFFEVSQGETGARHIA